MESLSAIGFLLTMVSAVAGIALGGKEGGMMPWFALIIGTAFWNPWVWIACGCAAFYFGVIRVLQIRPSTKR